MVDGFSYSGYGYWSSFRQTIDQWASLGIFDVLLPMVLVFAIVFAILEKINILNNRGVNLIIALATAFFTIANSYVSGFFLYLFSNLGLAIVILLALMILIGIAVKPEEGSGRYIFGFVGGALFLIVLGRSGALKMLFGQGFEYWIKANLATVLIFGLIILAVIAVVAMGKERKGLTIKTGEQIH